MTYSCLQCKFIFYFTGPRSVIVFQAKNVERRCDNFPGVIFQQVVSLLFADNVVADPPQPVVKVTKAKRKKKKHKQTKNDGRRSKLSHHRRKLLDNQALSSEPTIATSARDKFHESRPSVQLDSSSGNLQGLLSTKGSSLSVSHKEPKSAGSGIQRTAVNRIAVAKRDPGQTQSAKMHIVFSSPKPVVQRPTVVHAFVTPPLDDREPDVVMPTGVSMTTANQDSSSDSEPEQHTLNTSSQRLQASLPRYQGAFPSPRGACPSPRTPVPAAAAAAALDAVSAQEPRKLTKVSVGTTPTFPLASNMKWIAMILEIFQSKTRCS